MTHSDTESGISGWSDVCEISETTDSSKSCMHLLRMEMAVHGILQSHTCSVSMQETELLCIERHDNYYKPSHAVSGESAAERRRRIKRKKVPGIQDSGFSTLSDSDGTRKTTNSKWVQRL